MRCASVTGHLTLESVMRVELPPTDNEGYLPDTWRVDIAPGIAAQEGIAITDALREIVHFVREYFRRMQGMAEHRTLPKMLPDR